MSVQGVNHINIAVPVPLMNAVRDFYIDALGFTATRRGTAERVGYWLWAGESPLVHLMEPRDDAVADTTGSGVIDHLAFTCCDIEAMKARLEGQGVDYRVREAPEDGFTQLFVMDPAGVRVELNFPH